MRFLASITLCLALASLGHANQSELAKVGAIQYRHFGFIPVFDATFRAASDQLATDPLSEFPKELEFQYARKIPRKTLIQAAEKILRRNRSAEELDTIASRIEALNEAYQDVGPGDRYTLRYEPGLGTSLLRNGELERRIPGDDFHRIYFSIWLGPDAPFEFIPADPIY
jgi:hypothetical protein